MGMLSAADKARMVKDIQSIHEDWSKTVTIKNQKLFTQQDEDGVAWDATEVFDDSFQVQAIVYTYAQKDRAKTIEASKQFKEAGIQEEYDLYIEITKKNLGTNTFDERSVIEVDGVDYYILGGTMIYENDIHAKLSIEKTSA